MKLTQRIQFKVTKKDEKMLIRKAALLNMSVSAYIRLKVLNSEKTILEI